MLLWLYTLRHSNLWRFAEAIVRQSARWRENLNSGSVSFAHLIDTQVALVEMLKSKAKDAN